MAVGWSVFRRLGGAWLVIGVLIAAGASDASAIRAQGSHQVPVSPIRTPAAAHPGPPPALPDEAWRLAPFTIDMRVAVGGDVRRQVVTRTVTDVHITASAEREWFYRRNATDARRVAGFLVDHRQRVVVRYDESDLRTHFGIRGWLDVLTLGFDSHALERMRRTGDQRILNGVTCDRYVAVEPEGDVREVCWSRAALLPIEVVRRAPGGTTTVDISVSAVRQADQARQGDALSQFRDYRAVDFPDWLERLDER